MAATYHLLCMDCRLYLSLGKVYSFDAHGKALDGVTLDGLFDETSRRWRKRDDVFGRGLELFLIGHRNHELRFVPEGVDELIETRDSPVSPVSLEEVLAGSMATEPDSELELAEWRKKLADR